MLADLVTMETLDPLVDWCRQIQSFFGAQAQIRQATAISSHLPSFTYLENSSCQTINCFLQHYCSECSVNAGQTLGCPEAYADFI